MTQGERLARAASGLIGTPFLLHGRDSTTGMDCVGLLLASLNAIGVEAEPPRGYALRNRSIDRWLVYAAMWNLNDAEGAILAGDVLVTSPGASQYHILIVEDGLSVIHAHAGLRRIVREPLSEDESYIAHWRIDH